MWGTFFYGRGCCLLLAAQCSSVRSVIESTRGLMLWHHEGVFVWVLVLVFSGSVQSHSRTPDALYCSGVTLPTWIIWGRHTWRVDYSRLFSLLVCMLVAVAMWDEHRWLPRVEGRGVPSWTSRSRGGGGYRGGQWCGANTLFPKKRKKRKIWKTKKSILSPFKPLKILWWYSCTILWLDVLRKRLKCLKSNIMVVCMVVKTSKGRILVKIGLFLW